MNMQLIRPAEKLEAGAEPTKTIDTGLAALAAVIASYYRIAADAKHLAHELAVTSRPAEPEDIIRAARILGLKARAIGNAPSSRLKKAPLPAIIGLADGRFAVIAAEATADRLRLIDPIDRTIHSKNFDEIAQIWTGLIVLITRRAGGAGADPKTFGFKWFLPSLWRYRWALFSVLVASFFVQIFGLVTPIFFQLIIDKVLVHKGYSTLIVLIAGLVGLGLFEVILQYLRSYTLNHTTNRIDVELGSRLFHHLFHLPLAYFETRAAGQTVARVRELETIRNFLTGQGLTSFP